MPGSYGICVFKFLRTCQTVPKWLYYSTSLVVVYDSSCCSISSPKLGGVKTFLILVILIDEWQYLIAGLMCIFLITNDVEHLFCAYLPYISPLVRCLFKSYIHFFLMLNFDSSWYILYINSLSDICTASIFCQFVACVFLFFCSHYIFF